MFAVVLVLFIAGCEQKAIQDSGEVLKMQEKGKILLIIAQEGYQPLEYANTKKELESAGYAVETASLTKNTAKASDGSTTTPSLAVKDANAEDYKAVVLIGGPDALSLGEHQEVLELIKDAYNTGKIVAAICISPINLAKAGILSGKQATCWTDSQKSQVSLLEAAGAVFVDRPVVQDGNIITANGPDAATAFGKKIVEALS